MLSSGWSQTEVEAIVSDYFDMLASELSDRPYNKAEHRRRLLPVLKGRSKQSIEFKHANISAVLIDLGFPYISGYKPRSNYQALLFDVVSERLADRQDLLRIAELDADRPVTLPSLDEILAALTNPPRGAHLPPIRPKDQLLPQHRPAAVNYLERESRNAILGRAGEEFVIRFEQARLLKARQDRLASKIEHISQTRGDGAGFDVLSFEESGTERLIEVKTTKYGAETPFFLSRNEVQISEAHSALYNLYRVFDFRARPRLFTLRGPLPKTCVLRPAQYVACAV